jgi:hypothetical protein
MSDKTSPGKTDPGQLTGPGGLTMRQIHEQVKKSAARDLEAQRQAQPQSRWQRMVRFVWGRSGRR